MTVKGPRVKKPVRTGFCRADAEKWSHERCPQVVAGHPCPCICHTEEPEPEPEAEPVDVVEEMLTSPWPESWTEQRLTWQEPNGDPHEGRYEYSAEWARGMVKMLAERGCTQIRVFEGTAVVETWTEVPQ